MATQIRVSKKRKQRMAYMPSKKQLNQSVPDESRIDPEM